MASPSNGDIDPRQLRERLAVSRETMGRLLAVSAKTIERWEMQGKPPSRPESLQRLAEIAGLGSVVYTREGFVQFLKTTLAEAVGRSPIQLIANDESLKVLAALAADYEGLGY